VLVDLVELVQRQTELLVMQELPLTALDGQLVVLEELHL
jgi:hypothetical protein